MTAETSGAPASGYRGFLILCALLVAGHIAAIGLPEWCRKIVSETLFFGDSLLALFYLNRTRRRSLGTARTFWLLFSISIGIFAISSLLWLFEFLLGRFPFQAVLAISYRLYAIPLAMTLFLRSEDESPGRINKEVALDFLQLGILSWFALFALYYFPAKTLGEGEMERYGAVDIGNKINLVLLLIGYVRWRVETSATMRLLRGRLLTFVAAYSVVSAIGNFIDVSGKARSAASFDVVWAIPYLMAAGIAVTWDEKSSQNICESPSKKLPALTFENLGVAAICLAVAVLSDRVPEPWHSLANVAVAISLFAYSARLTISQYRQRKELEAREGTEQQLREARDQLALSLKSARLRAIEANLLTEVGHFLQACINEGEVYQLVGSALKQILPECSGALYNVNSGGKRISVIRQWGEAPPVQKDFDGSLCWGMRRNRSHTVNDRGPLPCSHLTESENILSLCIPLTASGDTTGLLVLVGNPGLREKSESELRKLFTKVRRVGQSIAEQVGLTLTNLRLRDALQEQAIRDPLTGLYNRRHLDEMLNCELQRAQRQDRPLSLLMLDIDHFKRLNDTFGHDAGDLVLRTLGTYLRNSIRVADVACRSGGEEFVIIMPEARLADAARRAQELCDGVRALRIEYQMQRLDPVTVSIGVASLSSDLASCDKLLHAVDAALYHAKRRGRDRIALSDQVQLASSAKVTADTLTAAANS